MIGLFCLQRRLLPALPWLLTLIGLFRLQRRPLSEYKYLGIEKYKNKKYKNTKI